MPLPIVDAELGEALTPYGSKPMLSPAADSEVDISEHADRITPMHSPILGAKGAGKGRPVRSSSKEHVRTDYAEEVINYSIASGTSDCSGPPRLTRTWSDASDWLPNSLRFVGKHRSRQWVHALTHAQNEGCADDVGAPPTEQEVKPKRWRLWLLILIASVVAGCSTFCCSAAGAFLQNVVRGFGGGHPLLYSTLFQVALCVAAYCTTVLFTCLSDKQLGQFIGGSGIPELKCTLGGVHLVGLFNWRILVAKLVGLSLCTGGGLPVGMEGPFIHTACSVAHTMMRRIPLFRSLFFSRQERQMATVTMVAVGVACTFCAPLGGVLFALEVTDSFATHAYIHCFFGSTVASFTNQILRRCIPQGSVFYFKPLFDGSLVDIEYATTIQMCTMYCLYIVLGSVCGLLGAAFVRVHRLVTRRIGRMVAATRKGRMYFVLVVAATGALNTLITRSAPFFRAYDTQPKVLSALTTGSSDAIDWGESPILNMFGCMANRFFVTIFVLSLPLPNGTVAPSFIIGALIGRLFGTVCKPVLSNFVWFAGGHGWHEVFNGYFFARFAVVGSSAFVAGSMRSFAQVIIVFERVAMPGMLIPLCAASLAAIFVANTLEQNLFDSVISLKQLPHLPSLAQGREALKVGDIISKDIPVISQPVTPEKIAAAREEYPEWHYEVPIVLALSPTFSDSGGFSRESSPHPERRVSACSHSTEPFQRQYSLDLDDSPIPCRPGLDSLVVISALKAFPLAKDEVVPLHVSDDTTLKSLLPLFSALDKTIAFVTKDGFLIGAVSLTDLYERAVDRSV